MADLVPATGRERRAALVQDCGELTVLNALFAWGDYAQGGHIWLLFPAVSALCLLKALSVAMGWWGRGRGR